MMKEKYEVISGS